MWIGEHLGRLKNLSRMVIGEQIFYGSISNMHYQLDNRLTPTWLYSKVIIAHVMLS